MISQFLSDAVGFVWGYPVVILCAFSGIYYTIFKLKFIQFRCFPHAVALLRGKYDNPNEKGHITHFQALSAALSGTIGLGNIAGVAIAIALGGPGAVFWMWIMGIFGMATKFAECTLGTKYRNENPETGDVRGGPMYYIVAGLGKKFKPLATMYAICIGLGAYGVGSMFQSNQAASGLFTNYGIPMGVTGFVMAGLCGAVIIGGIERIGKVASRIVPTMCAVYVFTAIGICLLNYELLPYVFQIIFTDAFTGSAAAGGAIGTVIKMGVKRAVFSNEAGLGSASIAHAAVKTDHPVREGIVASMGPFIDTVVVCSATAAIIIMSGLYGTAMYGNAGSMTMSFDQPSQIMMSSGWQIVDQNIPEESEKLRQYRDGATVLKYKASPVVGVATTRSFPVVSEGRSKLSGELGRHMIGEAIRFSSYRSGEGFYSVHVIDENNERIGVLKLIPSGDIVYLKDAKGAPQKAISISSSGTDQSWESYIINFHDEFISRATQEGASLDKIKLSFVASSGSADWYLDRIQVVDKLSGIDLTIAAFDSFIQGFGKIFISFSVLLFAFSTMITWSYYGEVGSEFVVGKSYSLAYKWVFVGTVFLGSLLSLTDIVNFGDLLIGLMAIPNSIAILLLAPIVVKEANHYFKRLKAGEFKTYK